MKYLLLTCYFFLMLAKLVAASKLEFLSDLFDRGLEFDQFEPDNCHVLAVDTSVSFQQNLVGRFHV